MARCNMRHLDELPYSIARGRIMTISKSLETANLKSAIKQSEAYGRGEHQRADDARILLEALVNSSSDAIVGKTCEGIITSWNPGAERIFGYTAQEAIGQSTQILFPPGQLNEELDILARIARGEHVRSFDTVRLRKDGTLVQVSVTVSPITDSHGTIVGASKIARDITQRKEAEAALRTSQAILNQLNADLEKTAAENAVIADALYNEKERAQVTLNSIGDAVISTDIDGRVSFLNGAAERLTRWTSTDATGRLVEEVFHVVQAETREVISNVMALATEQDEIVAFPPSCILVRRDRTELHIEDSCAPIHDRDGRVTGAVMVFHDASTAHGLSRQLAYQAAHDSLTDLPNRSLLSDRLAQAMAAAYRHHTSVALLYLDVDRFKHINDSLGHAIGDRLLQSIASRLTACVRTSDTVSRQGGDEFVIMLIDINGARDAATCAEKLLQALRSPYVFDTNELHVSASIGIAICPHDGTEAEALLGNADSAMYEAKAQGRNNYQFYRKDLNESAIGRQTLEGALRHAIVRRELELHYQPIMDIRSGTIAGVETLLRWRHPTQGLLMPADFMPISEESGLIVPIGQWVLRTTCEQAREWQLAGMPPLRHAVNVSAVELRAKEFVADVATVIDETGIQPSILELELTETFLMQDSKSTVVVLKSLKDLNIKLALDDFGTGYSSLSHMRRFPIDTLKIDRSFVKDITTDAAGAGVVSAVINMAKSLHMLVVAEGVETREQLSFLEDQGCHEAQGYLFSPPMAAGQFATLMHRSGALFLS
jgi:diguanylate cyclase (GGDEF)-like protein/PAS domain S-box-containing protein